MQTTAKHPKLTAAGVVNMNLQTLRQRVDKALKDMQLMCENLDIAMRRVQRHQLDLRSFQQALQSDKDAPGASAEPRTGIGGMQSQTSHTQMYNLLCQQVHNG